MFISFIKKTINLAKTVVKSIDNEAVSEVIYWVILLVIVIVCSVALRTIVNYCMTIFYVKRYKKEKYIIDIYNRSDWCNKFDSHIDKILATIKTIQYHNPLKKSSLY